MMDYVKEQKILLKKIYQETIENKNILDTLLTNDENIDNNIYNLDLIEKAHEDLEKKYKNFDKDLYRIQKHKFRFQVASLILFIIISAVGVAGYCLRRDYIPWIAFFLLLLLSAPVFVMAGLETTYTFLSIDFCSSIGNSIISGIIPSDNKGLGTYLSCPPKETQRSISTAIYQYISNFDYLYNQADFIISNTNWTNMSLWENIRLESDKRDNSYFKTLFNKISKEVNDTEITEEEKGKKEMILRNLQCFEIINYLIAGLLSMTSCYTARNSINYIEEKYCYKNHAYMFRNVIFDMISAIGFIIMSVGLNKLIVTMKSHYARALRGKKEFNTEIINDD